MALFKAHNRRHVPKSRGLDRTPAPAKTALIGAVPRWNKTLDADIAADQELIDRAQHREIAKTPEAVIDVVVQRLELSTKQATVTYTPEGAHPPACCTLRLSDCRGRVEGSGCQSGRCMRRYQEWLLCRSQMQIGRTRAGAKRG